MHAIPANPNAKMSWLSSLSLTVFTVTATAGMACAGGSDGMSTNASGNVGDGTPTCESTGKHLCERACSCGDRCKTGFRGRSGTVTAFTWSDQADCEGAFAGSRCRNGGPYDVDYAKCDADIAAASCESNAIVDPPSCEATKDGG